MVSRGNSRSGAPHCRPNRYVTEGKALVSKVAIGPRLKADIKRAVDMIGGFGLSLRAADRILLKPNYNSDDPPPASTDLEFLVAVIELLREEGYTHLAVGESSGILWQPTEKTLRAVGVTKKLAQLGVPLIDFTNGSFQSCKLAGRYWREISLPETLNQFDKVIYLPCMKHHSSARFTMSLKLTVGFLPLEERQVLHRDHLEERCAELNLAVTPDLIIMDGRSAFITNGPAWGELVEPGYILASGDQVAIDVEGVRILQSYKADNLLTMPAWELPQIRAAASLGIGVSGAAMRSVLDQA